ncbi:protein embryo defective [Forsythia ovata]|uniref:Protein embryo defective n=1 Tax=Forsythia ovata TaxID=205694 RepID=A0ABD1UD12_9LAMI
MESVSEMHTRALNELKVDVMKLSKKIDNVIYDIGALRCFVTFVCNHFVFGFPYYWEEFAGLSFDEEPTSFDFSKEISGSNGNKTSSPDSSKSSLPVALDYLPVTVIRDLFMIAPGECGGSILRKNILDDILQTYGGNATDEAPLNCKNMKAEQKRRSNSDVIDAEPRTKKNKRNTVVDCGLRGIGPLTRSRTRMKQ